MKGHTVDQSDFDAVITRLRAQGTDDAITEVKETRDALGASVWKSVSAFANTAGGLIVLGVSEDRGFTAVEDFEIDRVCNQFIDGMGDGNSEGALLALPPEYTVRRFALDGGQALAIEIAENSIDAKPCYVRSKGVETGSFKRKDDHDIRLSRTEIFELQTACTPSEADRAVVAECSVRDLDDTLVSTLLSAREGSKALQGVDSTIGKLNRLNVTDSSGNVRLAGLLTVGQYPQQYFPQLFVDVSVHPTVEKSSASTQLRFADRVECSGPLSEAVHEAVQAVRKNLRTYSVIEDTGRRDELEVPERVLREAIGNAVLHREYHPMFLGQAVAVDVYPDRITVTSPGGLWQKTKDTIGDGVSRCRNQALVQLLKKVPSLGAGGTVAEGGGGIPLMFDEMRARSLEEPRFTITPDSVTVELRRHGADTESHRRWARDTVGRDLARGEDALLAIARRDKHVSVGMARDMVGMDSDEARRTLRALVSEGVLEPIGPEDFGLKGATDLPTGAELAVLNALSPIAPMSIAELSVTLGRTKNALRPVLRHLVENGRVIPTAGPRSRHRRYLLPEPNTGACETRPGDC